jgi:pimeloyl-ACP methyl ester carboxylesterase
MRTWLICLLLAVSASAFAAPDYVREKKWADEITPGIVVGDPVYLEQKNRHKFLGIYTEVNNARMGLVVVHGIGVHPDMGMIGTLRQRLPDHGYTTLSIQMPILAVDAERAAYAELFPEAVERLQLAVAWLKSKGYKRIALVSHSMGSRMSHGYMVHNPPEVSAWAALATGTGPGPVITYDGIKVPALDLYGAYDLPQVLDSAAKRKASLQGKAGSKQIVLNTDHFFTDREDAMVEAVKDFLDGVK